MTGQKTQTHSSHVELINYLTERNPPSRTIKKKKEKQIKQNFILNGSWSSVKDPFSRKFEEKADEEREKTLEKKGLFLISVLLFFIRG